MKQQKKEKLKTILENIFSDTWEKGGGYQYRYDHGVRVAEYALKIAKLENLEVDKDALYLAGLFHDIKKVDAANDEGEIIYESLECKNHGDVGRQDIVQRIKPYQLPLSQETLERAVEIIRGDGSIESKVLRDADEIGSLGYLQVFKACAYAVLSCKRVKAVLDHWLGPPLEDLKNKEEKLNFETSKKVARKRIQSFADFVFGLKKEIEGEDIN